MRNRIFAAILGGVFLLSTVFKVMDPGPYLAIGRLVHFGLSMDVLLVALAAWEFFLSLSLLRVSILASFPKPGVTIATLVLLTIYSVFLGWMLASGRPFDCGCLGPLKFPPLVGLARNLLLGGLALAMTTGEGQVKTKEGFSGLVVIVLLVCMVSRLLLASWRTWSWVRRQGIDRPTTLVQVDPSCGACAQLCVWLMENPRLLERVTIITPEPLPLPSIPTLILDRNIWRLAPATPTLLRVRNGRVAGSIIGLPARNGRVDFHQIGTFVLQE